MPETWRPTGPRDGAVLVTGIESSPRLRVGRPSNKGLMTPCVYRDPTHRPQIQMVDLKGYGRDSSAETVFTPLLKGSVTPCSGDR